MAALQRLLLQRSWIPLSSGFPLAICPQSFCDVQRSHGACRYSSRATRRMEKLGIGPDGKPLPVANTKKVFPRTYKVLLVNQDGSTVSIHHRYPHKILTLPLDPSTLSEEERLQRQKRKEAATARVYVEEEFEDEEEWDQRRYRDLIDK